MLIMESESSLDYFSENGTKPGKTPDFPIFKTPEFEDNLVLECISEANPPPTITWFYNDQELFDLEKYTLSQNGQTLTIDPVTEIDSGRYSCTSENVAGFASRYWKVNVFTQPVLVYTPPKKLDTLVHQSETLECEAKGWGGNFVLNFSKIAHKRKK